MRTTTTKKTTPAEARAYEANRLALRAHDAYEVAHEVAVAARAYRAAHPNEEAAYRAAVDATAHAARLEEKAERLAARAEALCRMARR